MFFVNLSKNNNIGNNENSGRQTIARTKLHRLRPARSRGQLPIIHFSPRRRAILPSARKCVRDSARQSWNIRQRDARRKWGASAYATSLRYSFCSATVWQKWLHVNPRFIQHAPYRMHRYTVAERPINCCK